MINVRNLFIEAVEDGYFNNLELIKVLVQRMPSRDLQSLIEQEEWYVPGVNEPYMEDDYGTPCMDDA